MHYGNSVPETSCPSKEDRIKELNKQILVDTDLLNSMDVFANLHGDYALNEMNLLQAYGNLSRAIKVNSCEVERLIEEQNVTSN